MSENSRKPHSFCPKLSPGSLMLVVFCLLLVPAALAAEKELGTEWYDELVKLVPAEKRIAGGVSVATLSRESKSFGEREAFWRTIPRPGLNMDVPARRDRTLQEIPEFLKTVPLYRDLKAGARRMILGDTLSTVRLLGGWSPSRELTGEIESYDLAHRDAQGRFHYRWNLLHRRLKPFIECGVTPFIVLDNVPYAFVEKPAMGTYGQVMGPDLKYMKEWGAFISELTKELVRAYGRGYVETWRFRVGTEPDLPGHWQDTTEKWCMTYDHAAHGVRTVLPKAKIGPGNFLSPWHKNQQMAVDIMKHLAKGTNYATGEIGSPVSFLAASVYATPKGRSYESLYWSSHPDNMRLVARRLKQLRSVHPAFAGVPIEFHEFGRLFTELGADKESRSCVWAGARGAAWTHQSYAAALDEGIEQIFTWHSADILQGSEGPLLVLRGDGWVRAMLEQFVGGEWFQMDIETAAKNKTTIRAFASVKNHVTWISISTFDLLRQNSPEKVRLVIDATMLPGGGRKEVHIMEYMQSRENSAYDVMHADLKVRGGLRCPNDAVYRLPRLTNAEGARFLQENWEKYANLQEKALSAKPWQGTVSHGRKQLVLERDMAVPAVLVLAIR